MFTGIVEELGTIKAINKIGNNVELAIVCSFLNELKVDQSIAHNGVCLTVTELTDAYYTVVVINESLQVTALKHLKVNDVVNLERCVRLNDRLDGHMVQGHVDTTAKCLLVSDENGSKRLKFELKNAHNGLLINKGSVAINGISLTLINPTKTTFEVAIIPYTFEHTNMHSLTAGDVVNIEFDIIGKYIQAMHTQN